MMYGSNHVTYVIPDVSVLKWFIMVCDNVFQFDLMNAANNVCYLHDIRGSIKLRRARYAQVILGEWQQLSPSYSISYNLQMLTSDRKMQCNVSSFDELWMI